jgi:integrase/recombinase XerC
MARKYQIYATKERVSKINPKNKEHIKKFFISKNMILSDASKKSYESDFNQWLVFILEEYDNVDVLSVDSSDMADILEHYVSFCSTELGNNERRIQRRMSSISSFFLNLKKKRKYDDTNPVDYLERPKLGKDDKIQIKQTFLTQADVDLIRKKLKTLPKTEYNMQFELLFEFGLSTMARVNAISNVKIEQLNLADKEVNGVLEKEGKIVDLFMSKRTVELIKEWLDYRKRNKIESEYLFLALYGKTWQKVDKRTLQQNWIKKIGELIGMDLHMHDLRHSGATLLKEAGMDIEEISKLLNHNGIDVTLKHYIKVNYKKIAEKKDKYEI